MSDIQGVIVPFSATFGASYFSVIIGTTFYGVACLQTFFYFMHYQNDRLSTKTMVTTLWVLNTVHEALAICAYKYLMTGVTSQGLLVDGLPEIMVPMIFTALVGVLTQGFFIHRIYVFSSKKLVIPLVWLPAAVYQIVAALMYLSVGMGSEQGVEPLQQTFTLTEPFFMGIYMSSISLAAVVDVLIAIFMCFLLVRERMRMPTLRSTTLLLHRLTIYSINSGIWTATFALLSVILVYVLPLDMIFSVFSVPLCSLYCNTLLANLNVRAYVQSEADTTTRTYQISDVYAASARPLNDSEGSA